jgi:hypothetical protein
MFRSAQGSELPDGRGRPRPPAGALQRHDDLFGPVARPAIDGDLAGDFARGHDLVHHRRLHELQVHLPQFRIRIRGVAEHAQRPGLEGLRVFDRERVDDRQDLVCKGHAVGLTRGGGRGQSGLQIGILAQGRQMTARSGLRQQRRTRREKSHDLGREHARHYTPGANRRQIDTG